MTFNFKYLGKFKFVFENNLKNESGDQENAFDEKKTEAGIMQVYLLCVKMHIYKNVPPQDESCREDINKQTGFPPNQCTYCTHG